jgi:CII-binding regulator of phage lambda lysogenization HflD
MDDPNSIIQAQKEQIARYKMRLKGELKFRKQNFAKANILFSHLLDVVTSYQSLLEEKKALDVVLKLKQEKLSDIKEGVESEDEARSESSSNDTDQVTVLMNSLSTLSAEKNKMEASFLADKKNLRQELKTKDIVIKDLQDKLKSAELEKHNYKSKLISFDRVLNDERHLKENLETQLNQLKTQFSHLSNSDKLINTLNLELSETKKKLKAYEANKMKEESSVLQALHLEIENLKHQHTENLMIEKKRANEANEKNRKLTALHEEALLVWESRNSQLSKNFAHYHQMRESDQSSIMQLKEKIAQLTSHTDETNRYDVGGGAGGGGGHTSNRFSNAYEIVEEVQKLKQLLIYENTKMENPIDLTCIFTYSDADESISSEKYALMKNERDILKAENEIVKNQFGEQNEHLKTLQEKVIVLNRNIDEYEAEIKSKSDELYGMLKAERVKNRDTISSLEADYRSKISQLEQQLQKQRERSLVLLEEKENEIRALKTSYELFIPKKSADNEDDSQSTGSGSRKVSTSQQHLGMILNQQNSNSNIPETYMIFYSNELARKDMELSSVRKAKRETDDMLRQTLKDKIMMHEELDEKIANLEQKVIYLEKMKSREGANLEYLKNVTISYLTTSDSHAKKKMLNAIGAVLKFDDSENSMINNHFGKKK